MNLRDLMDQEGEAADRLAARAQAVGEGVVAPVLVAAARAAILAVAKDEGGGAIGEPAADLRAVRRDPGLRRAVERAIAKAMASALVELQGALRQGFEDDARGRALVLQRDATALAVTVSLSQADLAEMDSYPIQGHTAEEMAAYLAALLRHALAGTIAAPLTGRIDAKGIPGALAEVARLHGARLANGIREAYQAGAGAGARALADALTKPFGRVAA